MSAPRELELPVQAGDGHRWSMLARIPEQPTAALLWLPALGVAARHYLPFVEAFAERRIATFVHELRGHGSSSLRAGHDTNWGYRELLDVDLPAGEQAALDALREVSGLSGASARLIGGHSLGGQLACCRMAMKSSFSDQLRLVASGAPYWRAFGPPTRYWLPLAYRFLPWLADRCGALPGHRIGFGGREARGVIRDWSRTALGGRYAAKGLDDDLEAGLHDAAPDVRAVVLDDDWLAPASSLQFLLSKMPQAQTRVHRIDRDALGAPADHFAWMQAPDAIIDHLIG